jgi:hypothetical protein
MREVIFVGPKDFVLDHRETARQRMAKLFEEIGLAYRVESANDPESYREQAESAAAHGLRVNTLVTRSLPRTLDI